MPVGGFALCPLLALAELVEASDNLRVHEGREGLVLQEGQLGELENGGRDREDVVWGVGGVGVGLVRHPANGGEKLAEAEGVGGVLGPVRERMGASGVRRRERRRMRELAGPHQVRGESDHLLERQVLPVEEEGDELGGVEGDEGAEQFASTWETRILNETEQGGEIVVAKSEGKNGVEVEREGSLLEASDHGALGLARSRAELGRG